MPTIECRSEFVTITETPETRASSEQLSILFTKYHLARRLSTGRDVLEAACGAGVGLGCIASVARSTTAGDIDAGNCRAARATYQGRPGIRIERFDGLSLPFAAGSFDTVLLLEALYYLPSAGAFLREAARVLRQAGTLLLSSVNCEWTGFNPCPFSVRYYSAAELDSLLRDYGFRLGLWAAFPDAACGPSARLLRAVRHAAVRLHLIPRAMKGKQLLKRIVFGPLVPIRHELQDGAAPLGRLIPLSEIQDRSNFKMLYAIATKE